MYDEEYEADAYDITCRVCDDWEHYNITPKLAALHLIAHTQYHSISELGGPWWAMRVVEGYRGKSKETANLTPEDGWNRPPEFKD